MSFSIIPENVRQALVTLVPASMINEICCFVFYDNYPLVTKTIDITICTFRGEVKEFYKRELVATFLIEGCVSPKEILTLRNSKRDLFYLITLENEVVILSRRKNFEILHRIRDVHSYEVDDASCKGRAILKIICKNDAMPLMFDDNFEKLSDTDIFVKKDSEESSPLFTQLARKLTEARYSVKSNEKVLKDLVHLRQLAAHSNNKNSIANSVGTVFVENVQENYGILLLKNKIPVVRICNRKIVIILEAINKGNDTVEEIQILLQNVTSKSLVYTTKIFEKVPCSPYWKQIHSNNLMKDQAAAIVLVMDLKDAQPFQIEFSGIAAYKIKRKECILKLEKTTLSSLEIMGENFDVLANILKEDKKIVFICVLATSSNIHVCLRYIKYGTELSFHFLELLCKHLNFEKIENNAVLHNKSPYNILHGVLIVQKMFIPEQDKWIINIHSRSQSQVIAFLNFMHDAIPYRIVATTINQKIVSKIPDLSQYNEDISTSEEKWNYYFLGESVKRQASLMLEYFDGCMIKMNESKHINVQNKIGTEIDIYARGHSEYKEFRRKLLEEEEWGISMVCTESNEELSEGMVIDLSE